MPCWKLETSKSVSYQKSNQGSSLLPRIFEKWSYGPEIDTLESAEFQKYWTLFGFCFELLSVRALC